jgi:hypothetical protein
MANDDGDEDKDIGTALSRPQPDCTSGPPPAASADEVANTPPANKKRKLNEVLSLTDAMPDDNDVRQLYPHLCRALGLDDGFDPIDSSVRKSTVALLTEINRLLSTEYAFPIQFHQNQSQPALPETWGGSWSTRLGRQVVICGGMGRFWSRHGFWLNNTRPGQMYCIEAFPGRFRLHQGHPASNKA